MIAKFTILALLAVGIHAQTIGLGPCPLREVVDPFDVAGYLGKWYQIGRTPNPFETGNCSTAEYGPVSEEGLVKVHNVEIRNGNESSVDGTAELANPNSTEAKLIVKFFNPDTVADYWVLGTDYENYSIVWTCQNLDNLLHVYFSWILGRTKPLSERAAAAVADLLKANNLNPDIYVAHDLPECRTSP